MVILTSDEVETCNRGQLVVDVIATQPLAYTLVEIVNQSEITREAIRLPLAERLEVVSKIWDSVVDEGLPSLSDAQRTLIDERIEIADSNPEQRTSASDVFNNLGRNG
jgi:putative addiction module component (TIGR02574 family)